MRAALLMGMGLVTVALGGCHGRSASTPAPRDFAAQDRDPYLALNTTLVANGCSNCHASDYVRVGPAMRDVATQYSAGTQQDRQHIVEAILNGARGRWGKAVMPPQRQVTPARAAEIADAIIRQKAAPAS